MPGEYGREQRLDGLGVAPGIAIGTAYLYARKAFTVERRRLGEDEVEDEVGRFEWAVGRSERNLNKIISLVREKLGPDSAHIFEAQLLMLHDEALYQAVVDRIRHERVNADYAVDAVMTAHRQRMQASESEYLRERADDLLDVQDRLITHLRREKLLTEIEHERIVVAPNLTVADLVLFSRRHMLGCALDHGGVTSHVSIMARALGVPSVVGLHGITDQIEQGDLLIVDGLEGRVLVNPGAEVLERYRLRQERYERLVREQKQLAQLPAETLDGHPVRLRANLEFSEELDLLEEHGAEGVGLFRTEVLFLMRGRLQHTEEEQYETYRKIVEAVRPEPTTFRVLDLGGDKMLPMGHREQNPFLGWRGVRVLLAKPDLLRPQLRALLRASAHGPVRLLFPMITNLAEVRQVRSVVREARSELRREGVDFDENVALGLMVEVPSVALLADAIAPEVDFFSIGTNDLTQYTLAVERGNDLVAGLYEELHPAVLALIQRTVEAAHRARIPVSLCGELASNPRATPILVGLGLDELSASPIYLPGIKRVIRALSRDEAEAIARRALAAREAREVVAIVDKWLEEHACGLLEFIEHGGEPAATGNGQHAASAHSPSVPEQATVDDDDA